MSKSITLFMWGYQSHFRFQVQMRAENVLEKGGSSITPKVFLVGVKDANGKGDYDVCIEPEDGEWDPNIFYNCKKRAEEIYGSHPDQKIHYGDEPSMKDKPHNILRKSIRESILEVTEKYDIDNGTISFCGIPTLVEGYFVSPILQFEKNSFESYPSLQSEVTWEDFRSSRGFLHCLIERLFIEASDAIVKKDPGRFFELIRTDTNSILREAGRSFCTAISIATQDYYLQDSFDTLNAISSLFYEGANAKGCLVFVRPEDQGHSYQIQFNSPIKIRNVKMARKVIEMSEGDLVCLYSSGAGLTGLGSYDNSQNDNFNVSFVDHFKWELRFGKKLLMLSSYGVPHLPAFPLTIQRFQILADRIFGGVSKEHLERIWTVIDSSILQKRGTLIVITTNAKQESKRLSKQSLSIFPEILNPTSVSKLSKIDGAILLDNAGVCHAVGVILDGKASAHADMSRGSRYNSALRYVEESKAPTICIVISEDGAVDLLPNLRPQIKRSEIKGQIELFKTQNLHNYFKTCKWLDENRFYLTKEECEVVNRELARIYKAPSKGTEITWIAATFVPDPDMNDSYYLSE